MSLFLAGSELANLAALCVLAHGSEDDEAAPFLLPNGAPWSLPAERGLPPLVILLACGDDDGNLIDEAKRLIGAGAKTVLARLGRPTLDGAAHFLPEFLARWRAGERVDDALCRLAGDPVGEFGARRLLLLGEGELRLDDVPRREEWEDKRLAEAAWGGDAAALMTLLQRLTRRCAMAGQDIDEAEAELRSLFGINPRDEEAERHLLSLLDSVQRQSPHLVRAWILPLLARLSEAYAQDRIHSLGDERLELERRGVPVTAPILHYWSRLYYRLGLYGLALRDLARGLSLLDRANPCARGAGLLGQIVNVLIDLDLPQEAKVCLEGLDDCLANRGDADARWQRHLSKDRQARIALRLGRPRAALALYRRKRDEAISEEGADTRGAGVRELAGLLYVAAWLEPDGPDEAAEWQSWSIEALAILESCRSRGETIGYGNFDPMYLFRACALWGWRRGDTASLDMVMAHRALLRERLFAAGKADPGPPGFCFSYLTLAERDGLLVNPDIPSWDEIAVSLAGHGYYIELAALAHLHGRPSDAHDYLDRFQAQRSLAPGVAFPPWFHEGLLADWGGVIEARAVHERRVLNDVASSDVAGLVESGLLPF